MALPTSLRIRPDVVVVTAGDSATLTVGYHPADNQGDDGTLTLTTDDPDARTATIALKGYGQQAVGQFVPDDLSLFDFGKVTVGSSGKSQGVRIDNTGDAPLVITAKSSAPVSIGRKGRSATAISLCPMAMVMTAENDSMGEVPISRCNPAPRIRAAACMIPKW